MKKEALANSVEIFTIDLKSAPKGGTFVSALGNHRAFSRFPVRAVNESFESLSLRGFKLWQSPKAQSSDIS